MNTVISKDGTRIAYKKNGTGPVVILVDGAFCSKEFGPMPKLAPFLTQNFTVFTYDRRARGESGDTKPYAIEREIEDIDALIQFAGGAVCLFGISSGAILAMHAAAYGLSVIKLALFEPPFVANPNKHRTSNGNQQLSHLISEGKRGEACSFYLTKIIGAPFFIPFILRLTPNWTKMKANANSLPYDATICGDFQIPGDVVSRITIPVIVIDSNKSPHPLRNAAHEVHKAMPNSLQKTLNGKVHDAPPEVLAPELIQFFSGV